MGGGGGGGGGGVYSGAKAISLEVGGKEFDRRQNGNL